MFFLCFDFPFPMLFPCLSDVPMVVLCLSLKFLSFSDASAKLFLCISDAFPKLFPYMSFTFQMLSLSFFFACLNLLEVPPTQKQTYTMSLPDGSERVSEATFCDKECFILVFDRDDVSSSGSEFVSLAGKRC